MVSLAFISGVLSQNLPQHSSSTRFTIMNVLGLLICSNERLNHWHTPCAYSSPEPSVQITSRLSVNHSGNTSLDELRDIIICEHLNCTHFAFLNPLHVYCTFLVRI